MDIVYIILLENRVRFNINLPVSFSRFFELLFPRTRVKDQRKRVRWDKTKATKPYQKFRNDTLNRWDCKCAKCGVEGVRLVVHHLIPYSRNKDLALDPDNARLFCYSCDKTFHSIYGGNTYTPEDFYEFIGVE